LREADAGNFRHGVDDGRDYVVIHDADLAGEDLGDGNALVLGLVGEHRARRDVADRVDAGDAGLEVMIDFDLAALVEGETGLFKVEAVGVGPAADRDEDGVRLDRLASAARGGLDGQGDAILAGLRAGHLRRGAEGEALLPEDPRRLLAHVGVHAGEELVDKLDDSDLCAEAPPDAAQLEPDYAAPDHDHRPRDLLQLQRAGGVDDPAMVDLDAGQRGHAGG